MTLSLVYRVSLLLFGILVFPGCAILPPKLELPESVSDISELEPFLTKAVQKKTPPSISIAVVKNNQVAYSEAFGYSDAEQTVPASPETVYQWWSITKLFTAVAILQLHEKNLLSLDDSVVRHLSNFKTRGKSVDAKEITIKHLLSHSSGLGDIGLPILGTPTLGT